MESWERSKECREATKFRQIYVHMLLIQLESTAQYFLNFVYSSDVKNGTYLGLIPSVLPNISKLKAKDQGAGSEGMN